MLNARWRLPGAAVAGVLLAAALVSAEPVKFTTLDRGQYGSIDKPRELVVHGAGELAAVWKAPTDDQRHRQHRQEGVVGELR